MNQGSFDYFLGCRSDGKLYLGNLLQVIKRVFILILKYFLIFKNEDIFFYYDYICKMW